MLRFFCCESPRRAAVMAAAHLNGLDALEVVEVAGVRRYLELFFLKPVANGAFSTSDIQLAGGDTVRHLGVEGIQFLGDRVRITLDRAGDCGRYQLRLAQDEVPPPGFDPILSAVDFYFYPEENGALACLPQDAPPVPASPPPELDYRARDFAELRTVMFDRLKKVAPQTEWGHPADLGTALVELLAHVGDRLSYAQDAVATEAYLGTARQRISVRRHARLVDYTLHEGANARVFVQLQVAPGTQVQSPATLPLLPTGSVFFARDERLPGRLVPGSAEVAHAQTRGLFGFRSVHPVSSLDAGLNRALFYTWSANDCRLPAGATRASLAGHFPGLAVGDVLILAEAKDAFGNPGGARPERRHPVRLTRLRATQDPLQGAPVTEIEWHPADRLPFGLAIAARIQDQQHPDLSVVLGNLVLAEHGLPLGPVYLGQVQSRPAWLTPKSVAAPCSKSEADDPPARFNPVLAQGPLTWAAPYEPTGPASTATVSDPRQARPQIRLLSWNRPLPAGTPRPPPGSPEHVWEPRADLLGEDGERRTFVVEVDNQGRTHLRFGDDQRGRRPEVGHHFFAEFSVGNGPAGNVGAQTIGHVVSDRPEVLGASNPMAAAGGVGPESLAEAKLAAPQAFRFQERAVTLADYARVAEQQGEVQRAVASWRFTGSWRTVFLAVDRRGGLPVDTDFEARLRSHVERYRTMGHDLEIEGPQFVDLDLALKICVAPGYFRAQVQGALNRTFSAGLLPDGQPAFFHPDRYTFGQPVLLSEVYAAAHPIAGVVGVEVLRFQRLVDGASGLEAGRLVMGPQEIARLQREGHGRLVLELEGGR